MERIIIDTCQNKTRGEKIMLQRLNWDKIDREPICIECGIKATHLLKYIVVLRRVTIFRKLINAYCDNCLLIKLKIYGVK